MLMYPKFDHQPRLRMMRAKLIFLMLVALTVIGQSLLSLNGIN